jgi:hypothetical protein
MTNYSQESVYNRAHREQARHQLLPFTTYTKPDYATMLCVTNMLLHGIQDPSFVRHDNTPHHHEAPKVRPISAQANGPVTRTTIKHRRCDRIPAQAIGLGLMPR